MPKTMQRRQYPLPKNASAKSQAMSSQPLSPRTKPRQAAKPILSSAPTDARTMGRQPKGAPSHRAGESGAWLK